MAQLIAISLLLVFSVFGCAARQDVAQPVLRRAPLATPVQHPEPLVLTNPEHRLAKVRLGTPSGLGTSTRRVDQPVEHNENQARTKTSALDIEAEALLTR
jgi:hypothetical protein